MGKNDKKGKNVGIFPIETIYYTHLLNNILTILMYIALFALSEINLLFISGLKLISEKIHNGVNNDSLDIVHLPLFHISSNCKYISGIRTS